MTPQQQSIALELRDPTVRGIVKKLIAEIEADPSPKPKPTLAIKPGAVVASMVTQPHRLASFELAFRSIIEQVDLLHVILNGHEEIPKFLRHPKVKVRQAPAGRYGAEAKHFFPSDRFDGYRFTLDDDILYPPDYVGRMVQAIEDNGHQAAVGVHAAIFNDGGSTRYVGPMAVDSYYRDRRSWRFEDPLHRPTRVHILGTGTLAYHTSTFWISEEDLPHRNMDDIDVAMKMEHEGVPRIAIARTHKWLVDIDLAFDQSIYATTKNDDAEQTCLVNSIAWERV